MTDQPQSASSSSPPAPRDVGERLAVIESKLEHVDKRLGEGAETFGEFRHALEKIADRFGAEIDRLDKSDQSKAKELGDELKALVAEKSKTITDQIAKLEPKPASRLQVFGTFFGAVVLVGTFIWAASRYPERDEFRALGETVQQLRENQKELRGDVKGLKEDIEDLEKRGP